MVSRWLRGYLVVAGIAMAGFLALPDGSLAQTLCEVGCGWLAAGCVVAGARRSKAAVPASMQSEVKTDVCTGDNICAPTSLVTGKPVVCSSLLGSGVCMDKCFNDMMAIAGDIGFLSNKGCGTIELCIPCALVSGKGVPGCK